MPDAYRNDLAYIHDAGFGHFARAAAPVLLDALRHGGFSRGRFVDLGCGSGILSRAVSDAGYDVLGIDVSAAMIALAQTRVPRGQFRTQSLLTANIPACVAVAAVGECLNYLFDTGHSWSKLKALFRRIQEALAPGGIFLGDVAGPGRVPGGGTLKNFWEGEDWVVLVTSREDRRPKLLTREITSFRRVGESYRRDHEIHQQRLLPRVELVRKLRQTGFQVRTLKGYGPLRFGPGHSGFLARKPG
ncbi:MAG: class I SAM-dependent methyltransferase [Isosphaeraceae bacterium]